MKYTSRHNKRADGYGYDYSTGCHVYYRYDTRQRYRNNEAYIFVGPEDSHSTPARPCVDQATKTTRPINDDEYRREPDSTYWHLLTSTEILSAPMTNKNATYAARSVQAHVVKVEGYTGPIKGGEARAMSRFLTEIGKPDHVRRCWFMRETEYKRYPANRQDV